MNTVTGRTFSFADAIKRKLIRAEGTLPEGMTSVTRNNLEEDVTNAVYTEQKSYTITGAKDTCTGEYSYTIVCMFVAIQLHFF